MPNSCHQPAAISIVDATRTLDSAQVHWLMEHGAQALALLELGGEVRARVVSDAEMSAWHAKHLNFPETTDVLTFDLRDPPGAASQDRILDVDAILCVDEARRRADEFGHAPERELLLYLIHACLHCLDFDDHDPAGASAMHREEDRVLEAIGVGATFARGIRPERESPA